jgi:hypothetical protein
MGHYINPTKETKEEWLKTNGISVPLHHVTEAQFGTWKDPNDNPMLPVCLVDNGAFTAAGVCYCKEELVAFVYPDTRPRKWYLVRVDKLKEVGALSQDWQV